MSSYVDDLDVALLLLSHLSELYERLESKRRASLLHILARRIIDSSDGEIIDHELHSPFAYLDELAKSSHQPQESGSTQVPLSTPTRSRTWASASGGPRSIL
jgi:hypothetical protein